ncbi:MAG: sulfite exporter TauE/SafE family protein [Deltaproteobacteria bacterium]|nr:sulfite exporter TauE/SafE family protein [Deltaproteobacteria bacterium]
MDGSQPLFPVAVYWAHLQGVEIHPSLIGLIILGFLVGGLTGFFGVGGRLLMSPLLNALFNVPYNVAVGSDLCQMMGTSTLNILRFKRMSSIDFKLGGWMLIGTIIGVEGGVRILEFFKQAGSFNLLGLSIRYLSLVLSLVYSALLLWIGMIVYREARASQQEAVGEGLLSAYQPAVTARLQHIHLPPMIGLPASGIEAISLWVILGVGMATGLLVGFLGSGGGFIRMPALIYVIGCPMVVAIGTDLFESIFSMGYGTLSHSFQGNIDLILVAVLLITSSLGNQIGGLLAKRTTHPKVRQLFAFIAFGVVILLMIKLVI